MEAILEEKLETIGREYVHRSTTGYKSLDEVMDDVLPLVALLPATPAGSEYWIRVANDIDGFLSNWHQELDKEDVESTLNTISMLEKRILEHLSIFTGTQQVRLGSIANRSRASFASIVPVEDWKDIWTNYIERETL